MEETKIENQGSSSIPTTLSTTVLLSATTCTAAVTPTTGANDNQQQEQCDLSKNKLRKLRRYEHSLQHRKEKRVREREARKLQGRGNGRGNDEKLAALEKLRKGLESGNKVAIDCQFQNQMTRKELSRFAQQIRRVYSSNRSSSSPLHLFLTSFSRESELFKVCCKQNDGFEKYVLDFQEKSIIELFSPDEIVYLTPDATNVIPLEEGFEPDKVYVIGGYVDETTKKDLTHSFARSKDFHCARLPIDEFFETKDKGTFKKVLTVNQVVDIILEWHRTHDWVLSIQKGLPERCGFKPRDQNNQLEAFASTVSTK